MLAVLVVARLALGLSFQSAGSAAPYLAEPFDADLGDAGALVGAFMVPGIVLALPTGLLGLVFAALIAAIVSSLASMMNSISTIFTMPLFSIYVSRISSS